MPVADYLAPTVNVPSSVGRFKKYTEKHRFHIPNALRGVGGRATELSFTAEDGTFNCVPHALDFPVDKLEQLEEAQSENMLQEAAQMCSEIGALCHEKEVVDLALATHAADGAPNWGAGATLDPITDTGTGGINIGIRTVLLATGYGSGAQIRLLWGPQAWSYFCNNASIRDHFASVVVTGGVPNTVPTQQNIQNLFLVPVQSMISTMVYDSAVEGLAKTNAFVMDADLLIFATSPSPTRRDPSFMKTFRLAGNWMVPGYYTRDDGRVEVAKFDWSSDVQVTNTTACYRITPTFT